MTTPIFYIILATAAALLCSVAPAPTARPPAQCTLVLPPPAPPTSCQRIDAEERRELKTKAFEMLRIISNNSLEVERDASCHPDFAILSDDERGSNTSIAVHVNRNDFTEVSRAYDQLNSCFLPKLKELSNIEEELYKRNDHFQFYQQLNKITDATTDLVHILRRLVKDDSNLSPGPLCTLPRATCIVPYYPTTRSDSQRTPLTSLQVRIQHMVNIAFSIKQYGDDIASIRRPDAHRSYWETN